jgi:DNA-binding response OmpR family regulator
MRILVVDDEELMLKALRFRLLKDGHSVEIAIDGREALKLIAQERFDLVITDIMLPFNNGLEIVDYIKNKSGKSIPVIILSAVGAENVVLEGFALGADDYITKPFSPVQLSVRVKRFEKATS